MPRIALATSAKYSSLTEDDRLLLQPLTDRGFAAEPAIWDDPRAVSYTHLTLPTN